jgi:hypothetical protein
MPVFRRFAGRLAIGAAVLACLFAIAACGGSQPAATPTTEAASGSATNDLGASDTAAAVLDAYRNYGGEIVALDASTPSTTVDVPDLTGTIPAYTLTGGNPPCPGFVRPAPSLVFTLAADAPAVQIAFAGNQATNLIVVQEGEEIVCPEVAAATITPEITLQDAKAGRYGVWVGRIDMDKPVAGKLTASLTQ